MLQAPPAESAGSWERQQAANLLTIEADLARDEAIDGIVAKARVLGLLGNAINVAAVDRTTQGLAELSQIVQGLHESRRLQVG